MADWVMLHRGRDRVVGLRGNRDVVYYGSKNIATDTVVGLGGAAASVTALDVASIENDVPVSEGDVHPDPGMSGAICTAKRLIAGPRMGRAIVAVYYDSNLSFGPAGGRTALRYSYTSERYNIPQATHLLYSSFVGPPVPGEAIEGIYWVRWTPYIRRQRILVTLRRTVSVVMTEDFLTAAIAMNYGKTYKFGSIPCVLTDANVNRIRIGVYDITYAFESWGPLAGLKPFDSPGFLLPVPSLDYLEEWYVDESSGVTKIRKHKGFAQREEGGILP